MSHGSVSWAMVAEPPVHSPAARLPLIVALLTLPMTEPALLTIVGEVKLPSSVAGQLIVGPPSGGPTRYKG
jgi:hypothetical protein